MIVCVFCIKILNVQLTYTPFLVVCDRFSCIVDMLCVLFLVFFWLRGLKTYNVSDTLITDFSGPTLKFVWTINNGQDSSAGRAEDLKSLCHQFKSGSWHGRVCIIFYGTSLSIHFIDVYFFLVWCEVFQLSLPVLRIQIIY